MAHISVHFSYSQVFMIRIKMLSHLDIYGNYFAFLFFNDNVAFTIFILFVPAIYLYLLFVFIVFIYLFILMKLYLFMLFIYIF